MPVIAAAAAATAAGDSEDIATNPSDSPMPSESPDMVQHHGHTDSGSSSNLTTSNSTISLKSNDSGANDTVEAITNVATDHQVEDDSTSKPEDTDPTNIVTQSDYSQLGTGGSEKILQTNVGGAAVTEWSAAIPTTVTTSQLPSQYFTMSSCISTSETDQTLAPEQQDELSSSLSSFNSQILQQKQQQQLSNDRSKQHVDQVDDKTSVISTLPPATTITTTTTSAISLANQIDASYRLRSASLPSINLATTIEDTISRAYRVGSLNNVLLRKQGDGLESNMPAVLTAPVTSQSFATIDNQSSMRNNNSVVTTAPLDDRPLLLDGENRSDDNDQAVGGARTDVSNILEREGPLVGADSDEERDDSSASSNAHSETNFLTDNQQFSLLDHQLQFSLFEPSNLDAFMTRDSMLSSLRPPVTAGQEKTAEINPSVSEAVQVTMINAGSHDAFTTAVNTQPHIITTDSTISPLATMMMEQQDVSVTRSDFLHGTSKLSEVERPMAVGFTEWDKSPTATVTTQVPGHSETRVATSSSSSSSSSSSVLNDIVRVTSSADILAYLEPQGTVDSEESDSINTTEPTMDFGSLDGTTDLPHGANDNFGDVKDTNSFLKELEQDELLADQQSDTPKVRTWLNPRGQFSICEGQHVILSCSVTIKELVYSC